MKASDFEGEGEKMMKKIMICFCLFSCLLSGCSSEVTLLTIMEKKLDRKAIVIDDEKSLYIHSFSNVKDEGMQITSISVDTKIIEKDDSDYLEIAYVKTMKVANIFKDTTSINIIYNKSKIHTKYIYETKNISGPFMRFYDEHEGEIKTRKEKTTFTDNIGVRDTIFMLNEYLPILEKELDIKLSDYGYNVDIKDANKQVKNAIDAAAKEEERRTQEAIEAMEKEEAEKKAKIQADQEKIEQETKERYEQQQVEKEQMQIEAERKQQEEAARKAEIRKADYAKAINVLNYIESNLESGNVYSNARNMYQLIQWESDISYNMKNDLSFIFMDVQSMESDSYNREYYKNQIIKGINNFKANYGS